MGLLIITNRVVSPVVLQKDLNVNAETANRCTCNGPNLLTLSPNSSYPGCGLSFLRFLLWLPGFFGAFGFEKSVGVEEFSIRNQIQWSGKN